MPASSAIAPAPLDPRARQTVARVTAGMISGTVAGIAEIVKLVEALAANALEISVQELAELIEKDVVVTAKVLMAANTLGYNPSGVDVATISQAIHVIGFTKVRMLALSLLLMENAERRMPTTDQRETSTLALTSGMVAQAWAEQQGRRDADQVFLCASLRNFGRLLMAAFLADDYRKAREDAAATGDQDGAFRNLFGLTPLELGYELLKSANLPQPLLLGLRQLQPEMLKTQHLDAPTEVLVAAEFAVRVSELALQTQLGPERFNAEARRLCEQFGRHLHVDRERLEGVFERAEQRMTAFGRAFGLQTMARGVATRFAARREGRGPEGEPPLPAPASAEAETHSQTGEARRPDSGGASARKPPCPAPEATQSPNTPAERPPAAGGTPPSGAEGNPEFEALTAPPPEVASQPVQAAPPPTPVPAEPRPLIELLRDAMAKAAEALASPTVRMEDLIALTVVALFDGWRADEVVVLSERGKGTFSVVGGAGERWRASKMRMGFRRDDRNVLGVATARGEPVLIHDAADAKIDPYLPLWFKNNLQLYSCIIVPGGDAGSAHSVVLVGWRVRQKVRLAPEEARTIRALLGMVQTARRLAGL